jgi:hypothetical protein
LDGHSSIYHSSSKGQELLSNDAILEGSKSEVVERLVGGQVMNRQSMKTACPIPAPNHGKERKNL